MCVSLCMCVHVYVCPCVGHLGPRCPTRYTKQGIFQTPICGVKCSAILMQYIISLTDNNCPLLESVVTINRNKELMYVWLHPSLSQ